MTLTEATPEAGLAIDFDFSGSTAVGGSDFDIDLAASENLLSIEFLPDGSGGTLNLAGGVTTATVVSFPLIDNDADAEIINPVLIDGAGFDLDPDNNSFLATIVDQPETVPIVSFSGAPDILSEPDQTVHTATLSLTEATPEAGLAIDFDFSGSTAVGGSDFDIDLAASENLLSIDFLPDGSGGTLNLAGGVTTATVVSFPLIDNDADAEIINPVLIDGEGFDLDPDNNSFLATIVDQPIDEPLNLIGTDDPDTLIGGSNDDFLNGLAKNDSLSGLGGDDTLLGGNGIDTLDGGSGNDSLDGGASFDVLLGGEGEDTLLGGAGKDTLNGGANNDFLDGGTSDDELLGEDGEDTLLGGAGRDTLNGGANNDFLDGGTSDDELLGGDGEDTLLGGTGRDTLDGGIGNDLITGGSSPDTFVLAAGAGTDTIIDFGTGNDVIGLSDGLTFGDLSFVGSDIIFGTETLATLTGIDTATLTESDFINV